MNCSAIQAIAGRQLGHLLGNPMGYVVILAYVLAAGLFVFVPDSYYTRDIADLQPLQLIMPLLLIILLPALCMGSWASEREHGTEEQLLTFPMSVPEIILGKYAGIMAFFGLAMLGSLFLVGVVAWLGNPDAGLLVAHFVSWFAIGAVYAAVAILASSLTSMPAVAFVLGAAFSGALWGMAWLGQWFVPFYRGEIAIGGLGQALVAIAIILAVAAFRIASQRVNSDTIAKKAATIATLALTLLSLFNLGVWLNQKSAANLDLTAEGINSLDRSSLAILDDVDSTVIINAFVTQDLPPELQQKGQQVLNMLNIVDRELGSRLKLNVYRPVDAFDDEGIKAIAEFGLDPRTIEVDTIAGRDRREIFMSAVINSGGRKQVISYFDPGLSVEYELVRAIRGVSQTEKPVLGVVETEINVLQGFDFMTRQSREDWQIIAELRRQYEVRAVSLDVAVADDVDALLVPQASLISEEQVQHLHDAIWRGLPTMILEDPMPMFHNPMLGTAQPRPPEQSPMGQQQAPQPKADLSPIWQGLGIEVPGDRIIFSNYSPSKRLNSDTLPRSVVWAVRNQGSIAEHTSTNGIDTLLLPWPGIVRSMTDMPAGLSHTPLLKPNPEHIAGTHAWSDHFSQGFFGLQQQNPDWRSGQQLMLQDAMAMHITGTMKRTLPLIDVPEPTGDEESDGSDTEAKADDGLGQESPQAINVIVIADLDFAHDQFFVFYRNVGGQFSDDLAILSQLENIQFAANATDSLTGELAFAQLRTKQPQRRSLEVIKAKLEASQLEIDMALQEAKQEANETIQTMRDEFEAKLDAIDQRADLDSNAKRQLKANEEQAGKRILESQIRDINIKVDREARKAKAKRNASVMSVRDIVLTMVIAIPSVVLLALAAAVFSLRQQRERIEIPESRARGIS